MHWEEDLLVDALGSLEPPASLASSGAAEVTPFPGMEDGSCQDLPPLPYWPLAHN